MKTKLTNDEQVRLIKNDLRQDVKNANEQLLSPLDPRAARAMQCHVEWCTDLISRTDWTAKQFIDGKVPALRKEAQP